MIPPRSSSARDLANRLLARETAGAVDPAAVATAMQRLCANISTSLRRSVGDDGYNALLARALRSTETDHPVLTRMRRVDGAGIYLDGVLASVDTHGVPTVAAALESLIAAVADILGSLIGADMALNLLTDDGQSARTLNGRDIP